MMVTGGHPRERTKMLTEKALDFLFACQWQDLPQAVRRQSKLCLLDSLGAMLAGFSTPVGRLMAGHAGTNHGGHGARILVSGRPVSPVGAALANGFAANALDIDDGHRLVKGHPGACLAPLLFPALDMAPHLTGPELLSALTAGYELAIRAGMIRHATYRAYHSSGSWGAVAGAALVGRLLGCDRETIRQAMGVAEYHAPIAPMMKGIETPSMGKDSIGWGCMVAMSSALLAKEGFSGITPLFNDAPDPALMQELGLRFRMLELYFKPYAACRWGQPAVAGALKVMEEHSLSPDEVAEIEVKTFAAAKALPTAPPESTEEAQYSLVFPVAAAILKGEVGPGQVLPPGLHDPEILALAGKVTVEVEPEFEKAFPRHTLAEVIVTTDSGASHCSGPMEPKWEPATGLPGEDELRAKFLWLAGPVLGQGQAENLAELALELDRQDSLAQFSDLAIKKP